MSCNLPQLPTDFDGNTDVRCHDVRQCAETHPRARAARALVRHWLAVDGQPMTAAKIAPCPGGSLHDAWAGPDGTSVFSGPIGAMEPPQHMAHIRRFDGDPVAAAPIATQSAPRDGGTRMPMVKGHTSTKPGAGAIPTAARPTPRISSVPIPTHRPLPPDRTGPAP